MSRLLASELYASSQGSKCEGSFECRQCAGPCKNIRIYNAPTTIQFVKTNPTLKRPGNCYLCEGCYLYQRSRITLNFLGGGFMDGQSPINHSWLITEKEFFTVRKEDYQDLCDFLLEPPNNFCLSLIEKELNLLQCGIVNSNTEIKPETIFHFTFNNVVFDYSIYELGEGMKHGTEGKSAGVRLLVDMFGRIELEKRKRGRPSKQHI